jgi:uncharacterized protein
VPYGNRAMIFTLTELEHHPILFDVRYPPGELSFSEEFTQAGDLEASGSATLLHNTLGEIRVQGKIKIAVDGACDRCLEAARLELDSEFDFFYRPVIKRGAHGEVHLEEGEIDISFYEGDGVELEEVLREFVLLAKPMQTLCQEGCKGLCPRCGANLNRAGCTCAPEPKASPWSAIKDL